MSGARPRTKLRPPSDRGAPPVGPRVVAVADVFPPATRGGAGRALAESVALAGHLVDFRIVTRDHDVLTHERLPSVSTDTWQPWGPALVRYSSRVSLQAASLAGLVAAERPDVVYLNSLFSTLTQRILWTRRLGRLAAPALVLAPEGELSPGALQLKAWKKRPYLALARTGSLYRGVSWKAASELEKDDILAAFPEAHVTVVPYLRRPRADLLGHREPKEPGRARLLFLSRITPKKNLDFLLCRLAEVHGEVELEVVGPIEDAAHWRRCQGLIARLPPNVRARHGGACAPDEVWSHYAAADAFILPTLGENYGYVIADALLAGCPVLVSDRTPWSEAGASPGCLTIPLADTAAWGAAIQELVDMDAVRHAAASQAARGLADAHHAQGPDVGALVRLFAGL